MMRKRCRKEKKRYRIGVMLSILLIIIFTAEDVPVSANDGRNVTQNWAAAAVFYHTASEETETFHMTEEAFLEYKVKLETRLLYAYSAYYNELTGEQRERLVTAQKAWLDCYYAYIAALGQRWTEPVKVYFNVTKKERRTNVYREYVLLLLINRITDLEEWNTGRFAGMEEVFAEEKAEKLEEEKKELQVDMGLCLYVIQEEYRPKIREAHQTFFDFLEKNSKFVSVMTDNDETIMTAEESLQVQRMSYLTGVYYQGCRYFRREREE